MSSFELALVYGRFIYRRGEQANPFLASRFIVLFCRPLLEVRIFQDSCGAAEKDKPDRRSAVGASREALAFENGGRVIFAVEMMPDAVNPRFGDLFSWFEDLLSLRCTLHWLLSSRE